MGRPSTNQPWYGDGRDELSNLERESSLRSQAIEEELEEMIQKNADKQEYIEDVENLFLSMINSDDMPDDEIHAEEVEELYDRAQEMEF